MAYFVGWPIYQASNEVSEIMIHKKLIVLGLGLTILGINVTAFGKKAIDWIPSEDTNLKDVKFLVWVVFAANVAIGLGIFFALDSYLEGLGYTNKY